MRHTNRWIAGVLCGLLAGGSAMAQDWPQWRGANRDDKVADFKVPAAWPKELSQKWKVTVGQGDSTPALVGDKLFVFARQGGDEVILCLNAADGKEAWRDKYAVQAITGPAARQHAGPRSSPAVADGKVVTLGVTGVVSCLDAATGKVLWRNDKYKGAPQFFTAMSPIIVDGVAVVQLGGPGNGSTVAFNLGDGAEKWTWTGDGPSYASPVLAAIDGIKQIITLTDKGVIALAPADGKVLWQAAFAPQGMSYNAATPIIDGQTVIVTGQGRGTKALKVAKDGEAFKATELWSNPQLAVQFNTPVLQDGMLFGLSDRGNLFCINAQDGKTVWTDQTRRNNFGSTLSAGSVIVALPSTGEMVVFKPEKTFSEIAKYKVADTATTFAHPILSGNRIFVKDQDSLILWTIQ